MMNMKRNYVMPKLGKKGAVTGLVLGFCAVITLAGVYTFTQYQQNVENNLAQELAEYEAESQPSVTKEETQSQTQTELDIPIEIASSDDNITNPEITVPQVELIQEAETPIAEDVVEGDFTKEAVNFVDTDMLMWPVSGEVLMDFSMEQTIYFETLDQFKRNPAIVIAGQVDGEVLAAGRGIVQLIEERHDIGLTMTVDMGNGYQAIYGQLKDLRFEEGQLIEQGNVIGLVAEQTKYYSLEGVNVYFEMKKDGESINPESYLR